MKIVADDKIPGLREALLKMEGMEMRSLEGASITPLDVRDADALFVRTRTHVGASLLQGSRVKLVGTATIGTDHIDIPWCEARGIKVVNAPGCNAPAVMQYVASSLYAAGFDPTDRSGLTLGVVGKGNIGSLVVDLYRKAGARVLVCDPPRQQVGFTDELYLPLSELLNASDAVTFHVPYTSEGPYPTHHLLSEPLPYQLSIVVNASRGLVVDPAIIRGGEGRKWVIDTWPFEDCREAYSPSEQAALVREAFIATPHIAGYSVEGKRRATEAMIIALADTFGLSLPPGATDTVRIPDGNRYSLEEVVASFNPLPLSEVFKTAPETMEKIRGSHLRHEPHAHF